MELKCINVNINNIKNNRSHHEGQLVVSDSVAYIEASKNWSVYSMEGIEPRP